MNAKEILKKTVDNFNQQFVSKFKGENDPSKILYFQDVLDNPYELNKQLTEIPSLYAYWASMKREAAQNLEDAKNYSAMWEQSKVKGIIEKLKEKGVKYPPQKQVDAQFKLTYHKDPKYLKVVKKVKEASDIYEKIFVIEKAVLTKMDCLRIIAQLTNGMMNTGLFVKKSKGEF